MQSSTNHSGCICVMWHLLLLLLLKLVGIENDVALLGIVQASERGNEDGCVVQNAAAGTTRTSLWLSRGSVTSNTMLHGGVDPTIHEVV